MALVPASNEQSIIDKHSKAIYYMEKLFPYFEGRFDIHSAVKKSDLSEDEKQLAKRLAWDIQEVMMHEYDYADLYPHANCWLKLTDKGRHFQDEINQLLLFNALKQSPNYTLPIVKDLGVLLNGKDALIDKGIVIETISSNNLKYIRLNSEVSSANNVKDAIRILERKHAATPPLTTTNNYYQTTRGNYSPISGGDVIINETDEEQKEIARQGLEVSRDNLLWAIIAVAVAILGLFMVSH